MKYNELEKSIKRTTDCKFLRNGSRHPIWINPTTGETFQMSYHGSEEIKKGTLQSIIKISGVKI